MNVGEVLFIIAKTLKHMLFKVWKIKENVLHPICGILSSNKNEQIIDMHKSGWISRELCPVKKPIPKGWILYYSIYVSFLKWWSYNGNQEEECVTINGQQEESLWW